MELRDSVADYIRVSAVDRGIGLISEQTFKSIERIASMLPGPLTEFFGFECPLGTHEEIADFLVCAGAVEGGRSVLAGTSSTSTLASAFADHFVWRRIREFAAHWSNPQSPLYAAVSGIWLEFDMHERPSAIPVPSVFFGSERLRRGTECSWAIETALPVLNGSPLSDQQRRMIARCVNELPTAAHIFQIGLMLSRPNSPLRLCVRGVPAGDIVEYLRAIGWNGALVEVGILLDVFADQAERIDFDLDIGTNVSSRLGIECYPALSPEGTARLTGFLASAGYCGEAKANALERWAGIAHETSYPDRWPPGLRSLSRFLEGRKHSAFLRWLHHVKIVYEPGRPLRAKAYLAIRHVWLEPALLKTALSGLAGAPADPQPATRMN
jgi:hypothetical protein